MADAKFTPGPWHRGFGNTVWREYFRDDKGRRVHQPVCDAGVPASLSDEEKDANANLIAAAPEMYAYLAKMRDRMNCICKFNGMLGLEVDCTKCAIGKLLTKAEGEKEATK